MRMLQPGVGLLISVASGVGFPCHGGLDVRVASLGIRRLHGRRKMRFQEHAALAGDAPLRYSRSESGSRKVLGSSSSQVDPIVASFSGGAVGVISALMVVEMNNVKQQEHKCCKYCHGTGYLACARCSGTGLLLVVHQLANIDCSNGLLLPPTTQRCPNCSGVAKVMCPSCLCTGMALASEDNPRIDPFD